jgi:APA family basic amino acid/polyamine antiporter
VLAAAPAGPPPEGPERLPRRLGAVSAAGVLIGVVIGSGIFRVPSVVAAETGSAGAAALVWVLGAIVTLCGALSVAELSAAFPKPGGAYVFLREAYGPLAAFLFGWIKLLITGPSALAAVALVFAAYAGAFVPLSDGGQRLVAAALLIGLTVLNIRSVAWSAVLQNLSTATKVVALAALAGLILSFGDPSSGALSAPLQWQPASWGGFWVALIAVLWTYTGWVDLSYLAGEVRDPSRSYPRAMAGGLTVVVLLYLLVNAAFLYVLSIPEIAGSSVVASTAAERVFGATGGALVAALVMVSAFGSLNGTILSNPRVFFSMAEDGLFFRSVASVHSRYRTPHVALLLYLMLGLLGVTTQTFEQLAEIFVLGIWPFYALAVGAVIVLRRRRPAMRTGYRTWGYPLVPVVFLLISAAMLVNGAVQRPVQTAMSIGVLALGVPAYYGWLALAARRLRRGESAP